ncbi:phosphatidylethanolamine-binding protein [Xylariaceae sp. FL0804]|nr:phosphatidylethanolamine-binding protein [Xylariaceae sp. FL0804]
MSSRQMVVRPIARSVRQDTLLQASAHIVRSFSTTPARRDDSDTPKTTTTTTPTPATSTPESAAPPPASPSPSSSSSPPSSSSPSSSATSTVQVAAAAASGPAKPRMAERLMDPNTTTARWAESILTKRGTPPIGSRRRRVAVRTSQNLPFEQLPYQCFQEARKILQEDRREKLAALAREMDKVRRLEATHHDHVPGGERRKTMRLASMRKFIEELKILADINDPIVKRKFEDGLGDMNKPIYRHLAEKKWRGLPFRIITQRVEQLNIVPDVLPKFEPTVDVQMWFRRMKVEPGQMVDSRISEVPPRLRVQVFNARERLVSVVVMDSDVPNVETDAFDRRCHYLAANVPIGPDQPSLPLSKVNKETQLAVPWLPAFSQKGAPYHRLSVFVLEQQPGQTMDIGKLRELYSGRDGFSLKSYRDKFGLTPVGFNIFRTIWDEGTAGVMERAGVPGADIEFKLKRVHSLKPERKARGWEAKRAKPKYRSLWKYSRRIHGLDRNRR